MPNKDGTGPNGKGSMTGRKMGNCEGAKAEEDCNKPCRGTRQCRGNGRRRNCKE